MSTAKVKIRRRIPSYKDFRQLLNFRKPVWRSKKRLGGFK